MHKKRIRQKIGKREKQKAIAGARIAAMPVMASVAAQSLAQVSQIAAAFNLHPIVRTAQMALAQANGIRALAKAASDCRKWVEFAESQSADYHYRKKFNFPDRG